MSYHLPFLGEYIFPLKKGNSKWKRAKLPHSTLYTNRENLCCQLWLVGTKTFTGIPRRLQLSITNFVPRDVPSQNANTRSAFSIIVMLRFNGADLPYFSYSGKNSVSLIPLETAYSLAQVSIPFAPPDTISVTPFGRYFSKLVTLSPLDPTIATLTFQHLRHIAKLL